MFDNYIKKCICFILSDIIEYCIFNVSVFFCSITSTSSTNKFPQHCCSSNLWLLCKLNIYFQLMYIDVIIFHMIISTFLGFAQTREQRDQYCHASCHHSRLSHINTHNKVFGTLCCKSTMVQILHSSRNPSTYTNLIYIYIFIKRICYLLTIRKKNPPGLYFLYNLEFYQLFYVRTYYLYNNSEAL